MLMWIQKVLRIGVLFCTLLALLATMVVGTETRLLFFWPAAALLGVAAILLIISGRWPLRSSPSTVCLLSAFLFGTYLVARAVYSPVEIYAREDFFLICGCFLAYILSATVFSDPRLRQILVWLIVLVTVGNLAVGFIHFSGQWAFHIVPNYMRTFGEGQRIGGFFNNPNHLAAFLSMAALVSLGTASLGRGNAASRVLLLFLSIASVIGVALTISRGGLAGLAVGSFAMLAIGAFMILKSYPQAILRLLVGGFALLALAGIVIAGVFSEQIMKRAGANSEEIAFSDPRSVIWKAALVQYQTSPIIGAGARIFYDGCIQYRTADTPPHLKDAQFVHNDWLQLLSDYGWIGLILGIVVTIIHFGQGIRFIRWHVHERFTMTSMLASRNVGYVAGSMAALTAVLAHALLDFHLHVPAVALAASMLFGILANPGFGESAPRPISIPGFRPILKLAMLLAAACMIYGASTFGRADYYHELASLPSTQGDHGETKIHYLDQSLKTDPRNANLWYERGLTRLQNLGGQPTAIAIPELAQSLADLKIARQLNPHSMFIALALADACDASGDETQALAAIYEGIRLAPLSMSPRLSLAIHHHRHQRWEQAEAAYFWAMQAPAHGNMDAYTIYEGLLQDWQP